MCVLLTRASNWCSYGQTGTGKTFTMEGERSPDEQFTWEEVSEEEEEFPVAARVTELVVMSFLCVVMLRVHKISRVVCFVIGPTGRHHPPNAAPDLREAL